MAKGICQLSVIPLRAEPASRSEMVSQLLFGETFLILEEQTEWIKISTDSEGYEGWISANQLTIWDEQVNENCILTSFPFTVAIHRVTNAPLYLLPGSILPGFNYQDGNASCQINQVGFEIKATLESFSRIPLESVGAYATLFLETPYLWGGRTMWGMDCSGFVQLLYRMLHVQLPRDAWQQAELGEPVAFLNEARLGDLAFFENETGKIVHVGLILEPGEIIHASGKVRRDVLDSYGIFNEHQGKHTHKLRFLKRIIH